MLTLRVRCAVRDTARVAEALTARGWGTLWIDEPLAQHADDEGYVLDAPAPDAPACVHAWPTDPEGPAPDPPALVAGHAVELVRESGGSSEEPDWTTAWHAAHAARVAIDDEWALAPPWAARAGDPRVIVIEPGGAFGTGAHATTRDSLALLRAHLAARDRAAGAAPARVLDLGTGSGVLAVAAKRWGAGEVLANDLDEGTRAHVEGNARINGLAPDAIAVAVGDMAELAARLAGGAGWDVVLCNVGAAEVARVVGLLPALLAPGGVAIASGIFAPSRARVEAAARGVGLAVRAARASDDGWVTLALTAGS